MNNLRFSYSLLVITAMVFLFSAAPPAAAQKMDGIERERLRTMLKNIKKEVEKKYYDPSYKGIDLEARFKQAEQRLGQVETVGQAMGVIAQALMDFNDSHLYFLPPATNLQVEYGWRLQMIGDRAFITTVKPKSDAEAKGLRAGDQVLSIEGFRPSRKELWKMMYYYNILSKRQNVRMTVLSPGAEQPRELSVESKIKQLPKSITYSNLFTLFGDFGESDNDKHLFQKVGGVVVWRMPSFGFDPAQVDSLVEGRVKNASALVLDLRGNGGGYVKTLERLAGYFFEKDLKIADLKGRKPMDPIQAKTRGGDVFKGRLVVLIDHRSGSAAEIFARLIQLEKRGTVVGDVSGGAVMQAEGFEGETGSGTYAVFYGASITNADVIMADGKSVEHVGVLPDELLLLTGADLAAQRDPVLARAIELAGGQVTPEEAGRFFPYDWKN